MSLVNIQIVQAGQTLADFCLQHCGTTAAQEAVIKANALSYNSVLVPGQKLVVPANAPVNIAVRDFYAKNKIVPTTISRDDNNTIWLWPDGTELLFDDNLYIPV